jgi:sigma-B regulation protein RsbU (phosphoserine phosphatase)
VLAALNAALRRERLDVAHGFCSVVVGLVAPDAGGCDVVLASGGHPPPVLVRADGTVAFHPMDGGQVVGVLADAASTSVALRLDPGDTLLLYTDGLTEARTGRGARYDEQPLREFLTTLAPTTASEVVAAVRTLLDGFGEGLDDDTAVLALGVPRARAAEGSAPGGPSRM